MKLKAVPSPRASLANRSDEVDGQANYRASLIETKKIKKKYWKRWFQRIKSRGSTQLVSSCSTHDENCSSCSTYAPSSFIMKK